jgi:hypothetical protein
MISRWSISLVPRRGNIRSPATIYRRLDLTKRSRFLVAAAIAFTAACGKKTLTRDKALELLKADESKLLSNANDPVEFVFSPCVVPLAQASNEEMAGTVPLTLPTLSDHMKAMLSAPWLGPYRDNVNHQLASAIFFSALDRQHIIKFNSVKNTTVLLGERMTPPSVPSIEVAYGPNPSADIPVIWGNHDAWHTTANVNATESRFAGITGIAGEGDVVEAQVTVQSTMSPALQRLQQIARAVLQEQHIDERSYLSTCRGSSYDYICTVLTRQVAQAPSTTTYRFQRFDDGWRLAQ